VDAQRNQIIHGAVAAGPIRAEYGKGARNLVTAKDPPSGSPAGL